MKFLPRIISLAALLVWGTASALWMFGVAFFADYHLAEARPRQWQPIYPVRADAPQWEYGLRPSFYDVFRSAAHDKFRPMFVRISYSGVDDWNYQIDHSRDGRWDFPDEVTLYLTPDLSNEDRDYFLVAFRNQTGARIAAYNAGKMELYATALLPPLVVLGLIVAIRWLLVLIRKGRGDTGTAATP